jgi:hypothetical protein
LTCSDGVVINDGCKLRTAIESASLALIEVLMIEQDTWLDVIKNVRKKHEIYPTRQLNLMVKLAHIPNLTLNLGYIYTGRMLCPT